VATSFLSSAPEPIEQRFSLCLRYAGSCVLDCQDDPLTESPHFDQYGAGFTGVLAGIVYEYGGEALDPLRRGDDRRGACPDSREL
jgi:hypothetical protein